MRRQQLPSLSACSTRRAELLGVIRVQPLPAIELHSLRTDDASEWSAVKRVIQNIEANVPAGSTHRDVAAIDIVPKRETRAAAEVFELPTQISVAPAILQDAGLIGSLDSGFRDHWCGRAYRIQLHCA